MAMAEIPPSPALILILPSPGVGHLVPFAELAKRLVLNHGFMVNLLLLAGATASLPTAEIDPFLEGLPQGVTVTHLAESPVSDYEYGGDLPAFTESAEARMVQSVTRCLPSLRATLRSSTSAASTALVVDMFSVDALDVAREAGVPGYVFFAMAAMPWLLAQHLMKQDPSTTTGITSEPVVCLPGCVALDPEDIPLILGPRAGEAGSSARRQFKRCQEADGFLFNTFEAMEPGAVSYLLREEESGSGGPRAFPIGPLTHSDSSHNHHLSLEWLGTQPLGSVLFVCFGSGGMLSAEQLVELAMGLEWSGQRFLWVVRAPCSAGEEPNAAFFGDRTRDDPAEYLPDGFLDRIRGRGMVLPSWAPQLAVLGHAATGGFLTHCGWNSVLEAVEFAVPMIAWPLYAEQSLNAALLVRGAKIAMRPEAPAGGQVIGREEIARVVKALMVEEEGETIRVNIRGLQKAAARAVKEGGSSATVLAHLADIWRGGFGNGHREGSCGRILSLG